MVRTLADPMRTYRIGDAAGEYDVYSGEWAKDYPGRWNDKGEGVIYTSEHYSTAMLEKLVRTGEMPPNQHFIEIDIPVGTTYEIVTQDSLPGWCDANRAQSKAFGSAWYNEERSAILVVPSVVARMERNLLINPDHEDAGKIKPGLETPIWWDQRLFER